MDLFCNLLRRSHRLNIIRTRLTDIDAALEEGAILDRDACCNHIAGSEPQSECRRGPMLTVATHLQAHTISRARYSPHLAIAANLDMGLPGKLIAAFDATIDIESSDPASSPYHQQRFTNRRLLSACVRRLAALWDAVLMSFPS